MYVKVLSVIFLVMATVFIDAWSSERRDMPEQRRGVHYHSKRHMLPTKQGSEMRRRVTTLRPRDGRKKPSGHLTALQEDDIDNEIVSVAIGPPPVRPKYEKLRKNPTTKHVQNDTSSPASTLVKEVLTQLGREFLTRQVNEDFVFGQYVGNAMRTLTSELRLKMQHEILDLVVKYQKLNQGGPLKLEEKVSENVREIKIEKNPGVNETDDSWPDFTNLAKIVG